MLVSIVRDPVEASVSSNEGFKYVKPDVTPVGNSMVG